ncbi:ABC transporter substrate-binding protein [Holophaga foetida]|uniref:ABC transporter substrate-binding protein n=1 Tax=Holophaga foetida TaxID=35839 RepID=UPI000247539C|nr:ABC transporter substrate-binding protein [Holophaga foetida]
MMAPKSDPWIRWGGLALLTLGLAWSFLRIADSVSTARRGHPGKIGAASTIPQQGQATIRHARRFTLEYRSDCKIIRVNQPWRDATEAFVYQLVPRGSHPKAAEPGAILVETPIRRVVLLTTSCLPAFVTLDRIEAVLGVASGRYVTTPVFANRIRSGQIQEVSNGAPGMNKMLNYDRLFTLSPDLILATGTGDSSLDKHQKLGEAGFKVALCADYMENTPLGRAEWIKFVAAFLDRDAEAEAHFAKLEARYEAQKALARKALHRPTVLCEMDYRGSWYAPGGGSYLAAYIRDAGATYLLGDDPNPGSRALKIETVLDRARNADFWMLHMTGSSLHTLQEMKDTDPRYGLFKAFREGKVFTTGARLGPWGGSDYWENGSANPDLVLADLIAIFHPELLPNHALYWHAWLRPLAQP